MLATDAKAESNRLFDFKDKSSEHLICDQKFEQKSRYLYLADVNKESRNKYLFDIFMNFEAFEFSENSTAFLSATQSDFDVFVLGGSDIRRMCKILRSNASLLRSKVLICICDGSNATKRAQLMNAGFDDVFDPRRTPATEAIARIKAIWNRYQQAITAERARLHENAIIHQAFGHAKLSPRERRIALELLSNLNRPVSYVALRALVSEGYWETITFENLKVVISNLRKKLKEGCTIKSHFNLGYIIKVR